MTDDALVFAILGGAIALVFVFKWWRERIPRGWIIGPLVNSKSYSKDMPLRPDRVGDGWAFAMTGEPHYVTRDCNGLGSAIRLHYIATGAFKAVEGGEPGLTVHFQRKGDDWSAAGKFETYRWYSIAIYPLPGEQEITIPIQPEYWSAVMGANGKDVPLAFMDAVSNASRVGVTFGAQGGRGHGVTGDGDFQMIAFEVVP